MGMSNGENLSKALEDGDFFLPLQDHRLEVSSKLIEDTNLVNLNTTETSIIIYITISHPHEEEYSLVKVL